MGKPAELSAKQRRTLDRLKATRSLGGFYLAGGSAVAAHLHHRQSLDLDLFSRSKDVDLEALMSKLSEALPDLKVVGATDVALHLMTSGVAVDFVRYPYKLLEPLLEGPGGFPIPGLKDLGAMKLAALSQRGLRRDFWDIYAMAQAGIPLRELGRSYVAKFGVKKADLYHVLRAMTYFEDAEREEALPRGMSPRKWEAIKAFFLEEAPKLLIEQV